MPRETQSGRTLRSGFQGSETSGVDVTIYSFGDDPVFPGPTGPIPQSGRSARDEDPTVVSANWQKQIGPAAGYFHVQVKANRRTAFLQRIVDDDWLDLTFIRNGRRYHQVRGLIDTIREDTVVVDGATERVYNIRGRDHGKVWEQTQVYFNRFIGENVGGSALLRVFAASNPDVFGDVAQTVRAFLVQFLKEVGDQGTGTFWTLPPGIPGVGSNSRFTDVVEFVTDNGGHVGGVGYTNRPARVAFNPNFLDPQGNNLWYLAQQWSDPAYCELYTELVNRDTLAVPGPGEEFTPDNAAVAVIVRDRPLPYGDDPRAESGWFRLPLVEVAAQDIDSNASVGRGGEERYNAYFVKGKAFAEYASANVDLVSPLVDVEDIKRHGFRRFDTTSNYVPDLARNGSWRDFITHQRAQIRDWHSLNPYLLNGYLPLARGFPDIRVGTRVRVLGSSGDREDQTYYVEGVTQDWRLPEGMRTTLQVSRGWVGTDDSLIQALVAARRRYTLIDGAPEALVEIAGDGSFSGQESSFLA